MYCLTRGNFLLPTIPSAFLESSTTTGNYPASLPMHSIIRDTRFKGINNLHPQAFRIHGERVLDRQSQEIGLFAVADGLR
jgi:hypothetical protein